MRHVSLKTLGFLLLPLAVVGCSGSSDDTATVQFRCAGGQSFCIVSCDLGCSQTGCAITEIAENQPLKFTFNDTIAKSSVNGSAVSIRTASGIAPEGDLMVSGNELTFVPRVSTQNGISTFGFRRNETYIITIAGGPTASFGVRSAAGDTLSREFSCSVIASRGIVDADQRPPSAEMIAPASTFENPRDPTIVLRFSELIDTTPLQGTLTSSSPVRVTLRTANQVNNTLVCNRDSSGLVLEGIPQLRTEFVAGTPVTVVEFKPSVLLPGLACVEVAITADLRDLAGTQATPARFEFFTEAGTIIPININESFANSNNLNVPVSTTLWNNGARPGLLGGDGRHGPFDLSIATQVGATTYEIDTTNVEIPAGNTQSGQTEFVSDGKFYFTDFVLPVDTTLRFVGPVPPQIRVRGQAEINGTIELNGAKMEKFNARGGTAAPQPFVSGQPGGAPGAGGGAGGRGGDECQGNGPIIVNGEVLTNGAHGEDVRLLAGHAYVVQSANTGGRGSTMNPPSGEAAPNTPRIAFVYRAYFSPGGGGGGFWTPGGVPAFTTPTPLPSFLTNTIYGDPSAPLPAGGVMFDPFPIPTSGDPELSLNHFLIGGSGGGGGASCAFGTIFATGDVYIAGHAGSGGGGAIGLRVGADLTVGAAATLEAKGGEGAVIDGRPEGSTASTGDWGISSPGGGGSGGSFVLQAGGDLTVNCPIDTSGGDGSVNDNVGLTNVQAFETVAGAGAPGFYRLEAGGTLTFNGQAGSVPTYDPSLNSAVLTDRDTFSGCQSKWYGTGQVFPPAWLSYELDVDTNGDGIVDITYTDTGDPGTQAANSPSLPVRIQFQGAQLTQQTNEPIIGTVGLWRDGIGSGAGQGIGLDSPTGFRFQILFNRDVAPNAVVMALRVRARA